MASWRALVDTVILVLLGTSSFHILSPVADLVLSASRPLYAAMLGVPVVLLLVRSSSESPVSLATRHPILIGASASMAVLAMFLALHAIARPDSAIADMRYLMLVAIGAALLWRLESSMLERLFKGMAAFFSGYFIYVVVIYALMVLGFVDREAWAVGKLNFVPDENPLSVLERSGTQSYLVYYTVGMTRADDVAYLGSFEFTRLTAFFVEPSDAALVIGPMLLYCLHQMHQGLRSWAVPAAIFAAMLAWAYSVAGFLSMFLAMLLAGLARPAEHRFLRLLQGWSGVTLAAVVGLVVFDPEMFLQVVGGNKLLQFQYFLEQVSGAAELYIGSPAFGQGIGADYGHRTYGILAVTVQQGTVGTLALIVLLVPFVMSAWALLTGPKPLVGVLGFYSLFMFLKTSEIINLFFLVQYVYVVRHAVQGCAWSPRAIGKPDRHRDGVRPA
jgi:hypothetical protein